VLLAVAIGVMGLLAVWGFVMGLLDVELHNKQGRRRREMTEREREIEKIKMGRRKQRRKGIRMNRTRNRRKMDM
jgi:hypothetical protein